MTAPGRDPVASEVLVAVLAQHQWHHTRDSHCTCGFRTPLAQLAVDGYLAHVAERITTEALAAHDAEVARAAVAPYQTVVEQVRALADRWEDAEADDSMWSVLNGSDCAQDLRAVLASVPPSGEGT